MTDHSSDLAAAQRAASRFAARAEIEEVRLVSSNFEIMRPPPDGRPLSFKVEIEPGVDYDEGDSTMLSTSSYSVAIESVSPPGPESSPETPIPIARVNFKLMLLISVHHRDGDKPLTFNEAEAYAATTGNFALYPYAREYLQSVTTRMGLPALTLNVLTLPSSGPKRAVNEGKAVKKKTTKAELEQ